MVVEDVHSVTVSLWWGPEATQLCVPSTTVTRFKHQRTMNYTLILSLRIFWWHLTGFVLPSGQKKAATQEEPTAWSLHSSSRQQFSDCPRITTTAVMSQYDMFNTFGKSDSVFFSQNSGSPPTLSKLMRYGSAVNNWAFSHNWQHHEEQQKEIHTLANWSVIFYFAYLKTKKVLGKNKCNVIWSNYTHGLKWSSLHLKKL